ncbi:putative ATP-dependent RNA helicase rha-2 isoform X3 [Temnothorax curvispinosus]|uniref:ATP-dependent RNA helicase rha-2 isoform X3 n=1 Tax=Temnothorax curvispinosus TaxID=300111 RepID=A0A6J1PFI3_9HYME|nr:putative ATP-dependent RNA helicase rha-2 isoform X3 [Temnothorax curvispinosus]
MGTTIDGYRASVDGVKWFAYFFLEGQVYPKLKRFVPSLLTTPGSITKSWAKLIPRTQAIVQTLQSQGVVSKYKLLEIWGLDEKSYKKWLPESAHAEVTQIRRHTVAAFVIKNKTLRL